jgi:hypothetical protein
LTTEDWALFIQPDGPNTKWYFLGCHGLGDIEENFGNIDRLRCRNRNGRGFKSVGKLQSPPEDIKFDIETLTTAQRDWLEKLKRPFTLYAMQRTGGKADLFTNFVRCVAISEVDMASRKFGGLVKSSENAKSTISGSFIGAPPLNIFTKPVARQQVVAETGDITDVCFYSEEDPDSFIKEGDIGIFAAASSGSAAKANVGLTKDAGVNWEGKEGPFAGGADIGSLKAFPIGQNLYRFLAVMKSPTSAQGKVGYSDDKAENWATSNLGGASAGHGVASPKALFVLDSSHTYIATKNGTVYGAFDGGVTFTQLTSGLTASELLAVHFSDEKHGMAVGKNDAVLFTSNGGESFELKSVTGSGADLVSVTYSGRYWWVTTSTGRVFYSADDGDSWNERTNWAGAGSGAVVDIAFYNELAGFMIHNSSASKGAILRTVNGGTDFDEVKTPPNSGLSALHVIDENTAYVVGKVHSGTGMVIKVTAE